MAWSSAKDLSLQGIALWFRVTSALMDLPVGSSFEEQLWRQEN